jgi:hypothetical protein
MHKEHDNAHGDRDGLEQGHDLLARVDLVCLAAKVRRQR